MSYIRAGWPLMYVYGSSKDYVFPTSYKGKIYIEDYGHITNNGIIEILFRNWNPEDEYEMVFKEHLLKLLAKRLKVRLRKKPLTVDQAFEIMDKRVKRFNFRSQ